MWNRNFIWQKHPKRSDQNAKKSAKCTPYVIKQEIWSFLSPKLKPFEEKKCISEGRCCTIRSRHLAMTCETWAGRGKVCAWLGSDGPTTSRSNKTPLPLNGHNASRHQSWPEHGTRNRSNKITSTRANSSKNDYFILKHRFLDKLNRIVSKYGFSMAVPIGAKDH